MTDEIAISKAELESLQRAKNFLNSMYTSPEHSTEAKRLFKKLDPKLNFPELDIEDRTNKIVEEKYGALEKMNKELSEKIAAKEKADKERDEETGLRSQLDKVQKDFSFTDEGIKKVVDRMRDKNNPDVEAAAAWVRSQEPAPKAAKTTPGYLPDSMNLFGSQSKDEGWKKWHVDPMKAFDEEVQSVMSDPQYQQAS